jgi:hypothetical protein
MLPRIVSYLSSRKSNPHFRKAKGSTLLWFFHLFWFGLFEIVSLWNPGWPGTCDPPASASWVSGLQVCVTMPSSDSFHTVANYLSIFSNNSSCLFMNFIGY